MNGEKKLLEVYVPISIFVKVSKNVITEFFCVRRQKTGAVDVHEGFWREASIRTVLFETSIPGHDGLYTVVCVLWKCEPWHVNIDCNLGFNWKYLYHTWSLPNRYSRSSFERPLLLLCFAPMSLCFYPSLTFLDIFSQWFCINIFQRSRFLFEMLASGLNLCGMLTELPALCGPGGTTQIQKPRMRRQSRTRGHEDKSGGLSKQKYEAVTATDTRDVKLRLVTEFK